MHEPATTTGGVLASFTGGMIVIFGPIFGVWAAVGLGSLVGALWSLGRVETLTKRMAFFLLLRIIATALISTGAIAFLLDAKFGVNQEHALPLVSFVIGALGDKLDLFRVAVADRLKTIIAG